MPVLTADERDEANGAENGPGQRVQAASTIRGTISNHAASSTDL